MLMSIGALVLAILPVYFVARALQPMMAPSIAPQGGEYFAFLLVGLTCFTLLSTAVNALPQAITAGIQTGTLEALLATPQHLPAVFGGLISYDLIWAALRSLLLFAIGLSLGARVNWGHFAVSGAILALIVLAYLGLGMLTAALIVAFRTSGPLIPGILTASALLGGVYYPTTVIPSWVQSLSVVIPLTYGLRALRQSLLEGAPLGAIGPDVTILLGWVAGSLALGSFAMSRALRYARRSGTLAQY